MIIIYMYVREIVSACVCTIKELEEDYSTRIERTGEEFNVSK